MKAILGESFGGYQELEFSKHPLSLRNKISYSKFSCPYSIQMWGNTETFYAVFHFCFKSAADSLY